MSDLLRAGKLPADLLSSLLSRYARPDPRVVIGPGIGRDAAVIDQGDHYLVAKTDPITFATDQIGWYAVHVNANDIACMGARPHWFMASVLLPAGRANTEMAEQIAAQIGEACTALDVTLVGGHTEITQNISRPIVVGAMLGQVDKDKLVSSAGAQIGDVVLLTKAVPLEGTALIAREEESELRARGITTAFLANAASLLTRPGISVVAEALLAAEGGLASAMHDPTEGGLATGLRELAQASNVGLVIQADAIPFQPEGIELCRLLGLDPLGVIASGSLVITASPAQASQLVERMARAQIPVANIGRVVPAGDGLTLARGERREPLPEFAADEITRLIPAA